MTFLHFPTPSCRFFRFYVQFTSVYKYSQENNGLFWEKTTVVFEKTLDVFEKTLDVFGKTLDVFEQSLPRVVFGMLGTPEEIPAVIVDIKYVFSRL